MDSNDRKESGRVERRQAATRQRVIEVTLRLIGAQGYDATTMEQIAEEADIAKGTLYNHFPAKEAIISAYVQQTLQGELAERLDHIRTISSTADRVLYVYQELFAGVQHQNVIFERFLVYRLQQMVTLQWREESEQGGLDTLSAEVIRLGQQQGEIRMDIPPSILGEHFAFVFVMLVKQYYLDPDAFEPDSMITRYADLFLKGTQAQS